MGKGLQYRRTDACIVNAFRELVIEKGFERMSVKDILDRAMISKNTFYLHYRDKHDIAEQMFEGFKQEFADFLALNYGEKGKASPGELDRVNAEATKALGQFMQERDETYRCLSRIKTEKVNLSAFVGDIFRARYASTVRRAGREDAYVELEAEIYGNIYQAYASFLKEDGEKKAQIPPDNAMFDRALCNAVLYALRIIEPTSFQEAKDTLQRLQEEAKVKPENFIWS